MGRSGNCALILGLLVFLVPMSSPAADIPLVPYVEAFFATPGPLSLFCLPDGSGYAPTEAFNPFGEVVDGTLTVVLYSEMPPWGDPIPNYPKEDIWLVDDWAGLALCNGGSIPDSDTDADGRTSWASPMKLGGHAEPSGGNRLAISVSGWILNSPGLDEFRLNSADLDGNRTVNLSDVVLFTQGYFGPYDYSCDFRWDGAVNLSDLALLASSVGAVCP